MDSNVTLVGHVVRPPDLRFTQGGRAVASFSVAVSRRYQVNNEWTEQTSFVDVTAWADLAENVAGSLDKGDRVLVSGRLEQQQWESKEGEKRSKIQVVADEVACSLRYATATIQKTERQGVTEHSTEPF